jgi:DNA-binding response OmpR family regulator
MKGKETVLLVDDEPKILELLRSYLERGGYGALSARNGREGMRLFEGAAFSGNPVSLILLDLMLPDFPGEEFCRRVRAFGGAASAVPLIMITAKVDEESVIRGLRLGADDYVTKPFSPRELMARIEAVLRRQAPPEGRERFLEYGELLLDREERGAAKNGQTLGLTRDEYRLLALLMSRPGKIFTREEILEAVKGDGYEGFDRSVDSQVKRLRAKIGDDPRTPRYILTVYGMGYRFGGAGGSAG